MGKGWYCKSRGKWERMGKLLVVNGKLGSGEWESW
jgi:hypothetical protein